MIEVLKQALEALETRICSSCSESEICCAPAIKDAIQAGRQAIREHAMYEVQRLGQEIEQEPVAWMREDATLRFADGKIFVVGQPFYTHPPQLEQNFCPRCGKRTNDIHTCTPPPQRTWVGLTKEQLATTDWSADFRAGALWAEAKLKELNT